MTKLAVFTDKFKLMTHLFHSFMEMNKTKFDMTNKDNHTVFQEDNKESLEKIKQMVIESYKYEVAGFQMSIACGYFLDMKLQPKFNKKL